MVEFWGQAMMANNDLDESLVVGALVNLFDMDDAAIASRLVDYGYPAPHESHPIPDARQARRIRQVLADTHGRGKVTPAMHGYGPIQDFVR